MRFSLQWTSNVLSFWRVKVEDVLEKGYVFVSTGSLSFGIYRIWLRIDNALCRQFVSGNIVRRFDSSYCFYFSSDVYTGFVCYRDYHWGADGVLYLVLDEVSRAYLGNHHRHPNNKYGYPLCGL